MLPAGLGTEGLCEQDRARGCREGIPRVPLPGREVCREPSLPLARKVPDRLGGWELLGKRIEKVGWAEEGEQAYLQGAVLPSLSYVPLSPWASKPPTTFPPGAAPPPCLPG